MTIETDGSIDPKRLERYKANPHPFYKLLGARIVFASRDRLVAEVVVRDELSNPGRNMHGGAVMGLADHLGGAATILNMPEGCRTTTIESKTNFFAPIPTGEIARGECTPLHRGRTTMVWQTRITRPDGKLAALVTQTQMVIPERG
jgi:uncharacterized protein (TIGR00369 family)